MSYLEMFRFYTGDKIYRHAEGKKKVSKSAQSRVTCVVKADATGNGRGNSPCGGERSEKAPWSGNLRSPMDAWEPGGVERRHPGGQRRLLGTRTTLEGPHWEQTSPGLKDFCSFFKCLLNSALCEGVCQVLQGVGDKIRKMIGSLAFLLNSRKPLKVF